MTAHVYTFRLWPFRIRVGVVFGVGWARIAGA
jgi:hypothetical protein